QANITQSWATWNNLSTTFQATGSTSGNKFGYALAFGTQGQDGYFKHDMMYQPTAAFDPYATDPAIHNLGVYPDDTSITSKGSLLKGRLNFNDNSHLTTTWLSSAYWADKTGNGDNDYLPYDVALANGQNRLNAAIAGGTNGCQPGNPNSFTLGSGSNANGSTPGQGPGGVPDGGSQCQTPQSFAQANFGWQGAGTTWQTYSSNIYSAKYENTIGKNTISANTFTNIYYHTSDRTWQLPFFTVPGDNAFWFNEKAANTGLTLSDDVVNLSNEFGFGYFWENSAFNYVLTGKPQKAPITHDTAFFFRDAWHPTASRLTAYGNLWLKHSTVTNTSFIDPRLAFVWQEGNNVYRIAGGKTSTQPFPSQIITPFVPLGIGSFNGHITCSGAFANSIGQVPSSELKPEQGVDQEASFGHRFAGDSTVQLTLYNANVFKKIYTGLSLPLSVLTFPFDASGYINAVASFCGISPAQAAPLVGVSGAANIGHTWASGFDLTGRGRISPQFFIDYSYDTESSVLKSNDPSLINPAFGGDVRLIPDSQLFLVPLHKWNVNLDYTFRDNIEVALDTYHVSDNNTKNLPSYTYGNLIVSAPLGPGLFSTTVNNLWQTDAFYEGKIGLGSPLALNKFATASNYQPFFGNSSTERFGLPFRTVSFAYTLRLK
ncbi:MAG TPA: hypothetical protein VN860_03295, partial [Candidatus Acidoferrales bacterium]|nr:hypothetical protein [Candidatus Acidoferrales bacterium]